jgi:catechol 2,3-dioxygenase-like lactoylglutathione lyase family enzyme
MRSQFKAKAEFLAWVVLLACALVARADAEPVRAVDSIGITVSDMERSLRFYQDVLQFERVSSREVAGDDYEHLYGLFGLRLRIERLRLGQEYIELMEFLAPRGRPIPVDSRSNDRWFQHVAIIVSDMDRAYARLREHQVEHASAGPQRLPDWNPAAGGIRAFYFRDPDGNHLEILQFPPGKGAAKWHARSDRLFLGIDHTAIVVGDTEASLRFYRDALGFRIAGTAENYGIEQERLNSVFGARLRITALAPPAGPSVELLEYLAPRTGRPMPADTRTNDLWHWQVNADGSADETDRAVRAGHYDYVSPGPVRIGAPPGVGLLVRDPDGHALLVTQSSDPARPGASP